MMQIDDTEDSKILEIAEYMKYIVTAQKYGMLGEVIIEIGLDNSIIIKDGIVEYTENGRGILEIIDNFEPLNSIYDELKWYVEYYGLFQIYRKLI